METFLDIPLDLLQNILSESLDNKTGAVIESLNSKFIRRPVLALNAILRAVKNIQYIHFILLSYTFDEYCEYNTKLKQLEEQRNEEEKNNILSKITEMTADDYENLPEEHKSLYQEYVLKQRKLNTLKKREELRLRLMEPKKKRKKAEKRNRIFFSG